MDEKKTSRRNFIKKYGIGGLSALILFALPKEVKAGVSDNISSAEGTSYDDSNTSLGVSNVQKAIENLKEKADTLDSDKADKSHASADTTYGAGTGSNYGHVKLSDVYSTAQANADSANGVAASQNAVANAYTALNTAKANVSQLTDGSVTKVGTSTVGGTNTPIYLNNGVPNACNEFAPKSHASADTTYGAGTGSNYGHVKLSDTYATEQSNVAAGNSVGASAYALQQAYKTLNNNKVNNSILDLNTENSSDTWVPVLNGGKLQHRVIPTTYNTLYPTLSGVCAKWDDSKKSYFTEWEKGEMALVNNVNQTCHIHCKALQVKSYGDGNNWAPILAENFLNQSSIKTKENIKDISDQDGHNVLKLRPVTYDYKKNFGEKNQYGLIAEEVLELFPSAVYVPDDYDETKFDVSKGTDQPIISLDYSKLIPFIIKEIQLQDKRISKLEN